MEETRKFWWFYAFKSSGKINENLGRMLNSSCRMEITVLQTKFSNDHIHISLYRVTTASDCIVNSGFLLKHRQTLHWVLPTTPKWSFIQWQPAVTVGNAQHCEQLSVTGVAVCRFALWNGAVLPEQCMCRAVLLQNWRILPEAYTGNHYILLSVEVFGWLLGLQCFDC